MTQPTKDRRVDVFKADGRRIYIGMIDDPALPYLHWGDGYGLVDRLAIRHNHWTIRDTQD